MILGKTRDKGNAEELLGDSQAVIVTDDYPDYRGLDKPHQLCRAHILRQLRDLANSSEITGKVHDHRFSSYETFKKIYADIEEVRRSKTPLASYHSLLNRLKTFSTTHSLDPAKLSRVKKQINARPKKYLTCLQYPHVTSDNNAAERSLRHFVLK